MYTNALLFKLYKQVNSLVTNSNNGLGMLGEIKIMSKVEPGQLCIAHSINVWECGRQ